MLDQNLQIKDGKTLLPLIMEVHGAERLGRVFQFWMAELSRDVLRLGVYFRAAGIMLQVPHAASFPWVADDETDELLRTADRDTVGAVLAAALEIAGNKWVLDDVDELDFAEQELSEQWNELLERRTSQKHGLNNLIAACLDKLLVAPGMEEIDKADEPHWWQRWRPEAS
jgi:hypothetical protein